MVSINIDLEQELSNAVGYVTSAGSYLINPFYAAGQDLLETVGEWIIDQLIQDPDYADRKLNARGPTGTRRVIYGEARVGGQIVYIDEEGADNRDLHMVLVFAGHHCEEIGDVFFGEDLSTKPKYSGKHNLYKSSNGVIPPQLESYLSSKGITDYKYTNMTYVYVVFNYDQDTYQGIPQVTATVKGKKVFDPRTSLTEYSTNAALCQLDWVRNYMGATNEFIDFDSLINAANTADELVPSGEGMTEPRFALNGTIAQSGSKIESLSKMAVNTGIFPAYRQGKWIFTPQTYVAPSADAIINPTDIISDLSIITGNDKQNKVNRIKGTYIDARTNYEQIEYVPVQTTSWEAEDKEILEKSIDYPLVNSGTQCRRLSKVLLEQSRRGISVSGTFRFSMLDYEIGDRVKLNYPAFGWNEKIFKITEREVNSFSGVNLILREDSADIYSWTEGDAQSPEVPPFLDMPNPNQVAAPTDFSISEELYIANTKGDVKVRAVFLWAAGDATARNYEVEGSLQGGPYRTFSSFITGLEFKFDDIQLGSWVFRVRAVNSIGAKSDWTSISYTVLGKTAPPSDVSGFTGLIKPFAIELLWEPNTDLDVNQYEIRQGATWETASILQRTSAVRWTWEIRPSGNENILIKAIDTTGNYSLNASVANIDIQNPSSVEPLIAKVVDNNVELRWVDATTSFNIEEYVIRRGDDYTSAEVVGTVKGTFDSILEVTGGTYTYWVTAKDIEGNEGIPASVIANVDQPPDFVLQANQLIDLSSGTSNNFVQEVGAGITADSDLFTADSTAWTADSGARTILLGPANTTETWNEHFEKLYTRNVVTADQDTWTADSDTITADEGHPTIKELHDDQGYPYVLQPTPNTADFETVVDFGGVFNLSRIQLIPSITVLAGNPTVEYTLSYSNDGISYTDVSGVNATGVNFQFVKVRLDVTDQDNLGLLRVNSLRLRLDVKLKTDAGRVTITDTIDPTPFNFNVAFVDVQSIQVSANDVDLLATYNFVDVPNPTGGSINLQDRSTGNRVTGEVSWNVRGV